MVLTGAGLFGIFGFFGFASGTAVAQERVAPGPSMVDADESAAQGAFLRAAPSVGDLRLASGATRVVVIDQVAMAAELAAGSLLLPLPTGGSAELTGGSFARSSAGTAHWSIPSPDSLTSITLTDHGVFGTATVDGQAVGIVPLDGDVHLVYAQVRQSAFSLSGAPLTSSAAEIFPGRGAAPVPEGMVQLLPNTRYDAGASHVSHLYGSVQMGAGSLSVAALRAFQAGPSTIKLLVLLDEIVVTAWGGSGPALAQAASAVNATNTILTASGVNAQVDPVYDTVAYTSPSDPGLAQLFLRLQHDNEVDEAHALRATHDADVVMLLADLANFSCGIADLPSQLPSDETEQDAFVVVNYRDPCVSSRYSITHEIGHILGAEHDDVNSSGATPLYPYSYGWVDSPNDFVTIMSYTNTANGCAFCTRISLFSNDTGTWMGNPLGDATHNNTLVLNNTAPAVSIYRPDPCVDPANDFIGARQQFGSVASASVLQSTVCASSELFEVGQANQLPFHSLWYDWTAPTTNPTRVTTCQPGTAIDTVLNVWEGPIPYGTTELLTSVGTNDDDLSCPYGFTSSTIDFTPSAVGTVYYFQVDGRDSQQGDIGLLVTQEQCDGDFPDLVGSAITGTNVGEVIVGTSGADVINSLGGDDVVCAGDGNDEVNLGDGNDWIMAGPGADLVNGGTGDDELIGQQGIDRLFGQGGDDTVTGGDDDDRLYGGADDDLINGGPGEDRLYGQAGADIIYGVDDADLIIGGIGNDTIFAGVGDDTIYGQAGNDTISAGPGADTVYGNVDDDTINGDWGGDQLYGQGGVDTINGGQGIDFIYGGGDADDLNGDSEDDSLYGQGGTDTLDGGIGTDYCHGGIAADTATAECETVAGIP